VISEYVEEVRSEWEEGGGEETYVGRRMVGKLSLAAACKSCIRPGYFHHHKGPVPRRPMPPTSDPPLSLFISISSS